MTESESYDAGLAFMARHYSEQRQGTATNKTGDRL